MSVLAYKGAYVAGRFQRGSATKNSIDKFDPGNRSSLVGRWQATENRVDDAVDAAGKAFSKWAWVSPRTRFSALRRLKKVFRERRRDLAERISREMGKPLLESLGEVDASIAKVEDTLKQGMQRVAGTRKQHPQRFYQYRPHGVLAILGPFNFPLHLPNGNFVAALATGNTVIFKPSELTPFTGQLIAECFHQAGFPKGVFNMVQGGGEVGMNLVSHSGVQGVLFVGSDGTGRRIQNQVHRDPGKICVLEMGGKNASIIFPDAPRAKAVTDCVRSAMATTGQRCTSMSRLVVHESIAPTFLEEFIEAVSQWRPGYYRDAGTQMGPLVDERAVKKFMSYQRKAVQENAKVLLKAKRLKTDPSGVYSGNYVSPSIHLIKSNHPLKTQAGYRYDEIFGPDVAIYTFRSLEEAVQIHNDSRYGLVASVFTKKKSIFEKCLKHMEAGNIFWNRSTVGAAGNLPFGGIKASGNFFPAGLFSPDYCTYPVSVQM